MTIKVDGQEYRRMPPEERAGFLNARSPQAAFRPPSRVAPARGSDLAPEVQQLLDAMAFCELMTKSQIQHQVGESVLTKPNPITMYGARKLWRVYARLEQALEQHWKDGLNGWKPKPVKPRPKVRRKR